MLGTRWWPCLYKVSRGLSCAMLLAVYCCTGFRALGAAAEKGIVDPRTDERFQTCGVNALYVYLRLHAVATRLHSVGRVTLSSPNGSSMLDLKQASDRLGLASKVVHCSASELPSMATPFIARCLSPTKRQTGHYVVVTGRLADGSFTYIDSITGFQNVQDRDAFQATWSGYALVATRGTAMDVAAMSCGALVASALIVAFAGVTVRQMRTKRRGAARAELFVAVLIIATARVASGAPATSRSTWRVAERDGLNCLYLLLKTYSVGVRYTALEREVSGRTKPRLGMLQLRDAAAAHGLETEIRRWTPAELSECAFPVVLHLDSDRAGQRLGDGEFVLWLGQGSFSGRATHTVLRGGSALLEQCPDELLRRCWSGYALVPRLGESPRRSWAIWALAIAAIYWRSRRLIDNSKPLSS